jgi:ATP-dependent DNA helicase RecG
LRDLDALRRPLLLASADGFAGLDRIAGIGHALRAGCDRLLAQEESTELAAWRRTLTGFESLTRDQQAVEVARGLRLIRSLGGKASRPVPVPMPQPALCASVPDPDPLAAPTHSLKGIGPALAERLAERGITTLEDLLWLLPRRYDDARRVEPLHVALAGAEPGQRITAKGTVASVRMIRARGRRWVEMRLVDPSGPPPPAFLVVRWFNVWGGFEQRFPVGSEVTLSGVAKLRGQHVEMANPDILGAAAILPRHPDVPGVPAGKLRAACLAAVERARAQPDRIDDGVPAAVLERRGLGSLVDAIATLHAPPQDLAPEVIDELDAGTSRWQRRLAWGELFVLGVAVAQRRRARRAGVAVPCAPAASVDARLAAALPFAPTGAQRRAIAEIGADLARPVPMNRLLQGDVGSGKTAVAFAAALQVAAAGRQAAIMAPTEILAEQHHATLSRWGERAGLRTALLTASTPKGVRASLLALLGAGEIDLVVGTHSLLAESVGFARLGLAVIDEQHRFGVAQRVALRGKSDDGAPHLLVMTATPIPRTLALTAYGDLDVTIIDELPPGRTPATTKVLGGAKDRAGAYKLVKQRVAAGERVFVVCPLVEPADRYDELRAGWVDATSTAEELAASLAPARVGLVHGRMGSDERDAAMAALVAGGLDVLVATTVIEVGVDVPAATVMVVEDADHFGLAQLHQLRGRVGRGGGASWCLLVTRGSRTEEARRRLTVMAETHDGFRIAEEDLALRGPGELLGARQAGLPRLRFGDLRTHTELLLEARAEAERVLDADPTLERREHEALRQALARRSARMDAEVFGAEGG